MILLAQLPKDVLLNQLSNGLLLLVLGMGIVFAFLIILVIVTKVMSKIVYKNNVVESQNNTKEKIATDSISESDVEIAIAIAAATSKLKN